MKAGSKYFPLFSRLQRAAGEPVTMTFTQIEELMGSSLPGSARARAGWWSNRSQGAVQAAAWMGAGYHVAAVDLTAETVQFEKPTLTYTVEKSGDTVLWNSGMIKALRQQLKDREQDTEKVKDGLLSEQVVCIILPGVRLELRVRVEV